MLKEIKSCCGCQACAQACPRSCITMKPDKEGFSYPVIDETVCIRCGLCEKVCPVLQKKEKEQEIPKAYGAYCRNEEVRRASSSGGVFTLLAEYVLEEDGVVYGATMENFQVKHIRVADRGGLAQLRGSKYVQSDINGTYVQAKADLEADKTVLFTGTPCQIEGLKAFLQKDYEKLFAVDIICHGVPSPMVWEKYVAFREKTAGSKAKHMVFRDKKDGWKAYGVSFSFADKTTYLRPYHEDIFMKAFLRDLCLRPSCYQCSFKKMNRVSDLTIADFWGADEVCPEMDDDKGTSLVILHSEQGEAIFRSISEQMRYMETDLTEALKHNPAMIRSAAEPRHRDDFMEKVHTQDLEALVRKYAKAKLSAKKIIKAVFARLGLLESIKMWKKRWLNR